MRPLFLALLLAACTSTDTVSVSAERNARLFSSEMGLELKGVSCSGSDTDVDGYVSCTLNETSGQRTAIECGYDQSLQIDRFTNTACKMARPVTVMEQ